MIPRTEWGSACSSPPGYPIGQVSLVIVHHWFRPHVGVVPSTEEHRRLRGVERFHMDKNWGCGTGYNANDFQSGRLYEGRGWRRSGAHTRGLNSKSAGLALPIDGDTHEPTEEAWEAAGDWIREGIRLGHIAPDYRVDGHRDHANKSCPGDKVYAQLGRLRGLSPNPKEDTGVKRSVSSRPTVDLEPHPQGHKTGYWELDSAGGVFPFGDVKYYGSIGSLRQDGNDIPDVRFVGMAATATGNGYWIADEYGGVFTFGDAAYHGSIPWGVNKKGWPRPTAKCVGIDADPDGDGYYLVLEDGAVYAFAAPFHGRLYSEMKS